MNVIISLTFLTNPMFPFTIVMIVAVYMILKLNSNVADQRYPRHCMISKFLFYCFPRMEV